MAHTHEQQLYERLQPEQVVGNLLRVGVALTLYELIKQRVLDDVRGFYTFGFDQTGPLLDTAAYEQKVRSLNRQSAFKASLEWLKSSDAITSEDVETLDRLYEYRKGGGGDISDGAALTAGGDTSTDEEMGLPVPEPPNRTTQVPLSTKDLAAKAATVAESTRPWLTSNSSRCLRWGLTISVRPRSSPPRWMVLHEGGSSRSGHQPSDGAPSIRNSLN